MIAQIIFFIFLIGALITFVIGIIISYHFKKFRLPFDPIGKRILKTFVSGSMIIIFLNLLFFFLIIYND